MLDPLAQVVIGMIVAIRIGSGQLMVNILSHRERRDCQQEQDEA